MFTKDEKMDREVLKCVNMVGRSVARIAVRIKGSKNDCALPILLYENKSSVS